MMSYCRFSNADAYIYEAEEGFTCCGCRIAESGMFVCETELEMIEHIAAHRKAGHFVPEYVDDMLREELEDYIAKLEAENRALRHALELRECEETEHKPDPLDGVPFVSLSNAEIAAMTPEHPLYKLVKGDRKCKDE